MLSHGERDAVVEREKGDREDLLEDLDGVDRTNTVVIARSDECSISGNFIDGG